MITYSNYIKLQPGGTVPNEWLQIAQQNGFKDLNEVKVWQKANNLLADGKLGQLSLEKLKQQKKSNFGSLWDTLAETDNIFTRIKTMLQQNANINEIANSVGWENVKRFFSNVTKNPLATALDTGLYAADIAGVPSNVTNYLRDLVVSIPYRAKSAVLGTLKTGINYLTGDGSTDWTENYNEALANPSILIRNSTISPLINTAVNYSDEELEALSKMSGNGTHGIKNGDIKRVAGNYGGTGNVMDYVTNPAKVISTSNGQMSYDPNVGLTDLFDVNTVTPVAKHDNEMYLQNALNHKGGLYGMIRATMPYLNMIDIMPNDFKVQTIINKDALLK